MFIIPNCRLLNTFPFFQEICEINIQTMHFYCFYFMEINQLNLNVIYTTSVGRIIRADWDQIDACDNYPFHKYNSINLCHK